MSLTFEQPAFLWLLLLAVPVIATGLVWLGSMSRARAVSAIIARVGVLTLITLILAGTAAVRTTNKLAVVLVVDVSESVTRLSEEFSQLTQAGERVRPSRAIRAFIDEIAAGRSTEDLLGLVVFDGASLAVALPTSLDSAEFNITRSMAAGSDIAGALRFAETLFPPDAARRIVLISDGNATASDPLEAARELASLNTPIDVIPLPYAVRNEVMVEAVDTPPQAARGSTIAVRIVLRATDATTGRLRLIYEDQQIDINPRGQGRDLPVSLAAGMNTVVVEVPLDRERVLHRLRPVFLPDDEASDRIAENNAAQAFTITPGPGRVMIVQGEQEAQLPGAAALAEVLERANIALDVLPAELVPSDLLSLQAYDLIILQNVSAADLPRSMHQILSDYVTRLGGGLIMTGGRDALGAGGWITSPLAEVLPVELEIPDDVVSTNAAVALVIDRSGSMHAPSLLGGRSQMEIATEAAALGVEALGPTDFVTVVSFAHEARVDVPLQQNRDPKPIADRLRSINANGGTAIAPALELAYRQIREARTDVKHIIFLTDGMDSASAAGSLSAPELAALIHREGITITTIALGGETDVATLQSIAAAGGGSFYEVLNPNILPRLFISEVRVARQPLIRELEFQPRVLATGSPVLTGLPTPPPAQGLVLTMHRHEPTVVRAMDHPDGFPLLAHWFAGRGQVGVFTSDAGARWTEAWLDWPGYASLWRQFVRTIARPSSDGSGVMTAQIVNDGLAIRYESFDEAGQPRDLLTVHAQVYAPDGRSREVRLSQIGPGTYEASMDAADQGNYVVVVSPAQAGRPLPPTVGGVTRALSPEFQNLRSDITKLQTIAAATGGRLLNVLAPDPAMVFDRHGLDPLRTPMPIWPLLLVWCVVLFLLDVATRRIAWDRLLSRELAAEFRDAAGQAVRQRAERAAATVAALRRPGESSGAGRDEGIETLARQQQQPAPIERIISAEKAAAERAVEERKAELRRQTLARLATGQPAQAVGSKGQAGRDTEKKDPKMQQDAESSRSSLLDAKRRARSRYAEDQDR